MSEKQIRVADLVLGSVSQVFMLLNLYQTYLNFQFPRRVEKGLSKRHPIQKLLHPLLALGAAILSLGSFIMYESITGKLIVGSQSCNEILAFLLNIALSQAAILQISIAFQACEPPILQNHLRWPRGLLIFFNASTVSLWVVSIIVMFKVDNQTRWRVLSYLPNGITLLILSIILLVTAAIIIRHQSPQPKKSQMPCCFGKFNCDTRLTETLAYFSLILAVASGVGIYSLHSAQEVVRNSHLYISSEPKSVDSLRSAMITRAVALGVITIFTFRLWKWQREQNAVASLTSPHVSETAYSSPHAIELRPESFRTLSHFHSATKIESHKQLEAIELLEK